MLEDRVILKEDRVFVVSDLSGDVLADNSAGYGLYRLDTRFLSEFELRLNGQEPILLNAGVDRAYVATFQLVNPTLEGAGGQKVPRQSLSLRRTRFLHRGVHERIGIQNCNRRPVEFELSLEFGADFLDIFEVRGYHPLPERGRMEPIEVTECGFRFCYLGLDHVRRTTEVIFNPVPLLSEGRATIPITLDAQETFVLMVDILPLLDDEIPDPDFQFDAALQSLERVYAGWNAECTRISSDNNDLDGGILWRSLEDLRILCDDLPTGLYPTAGVPWYAVPFGRDALLTSIQALTLTPELACGTLRYLARHQGTKVDPYREEQPGKILHEMRFGELANLRQIPHTPYYGTVDATPLFLVLLVEYLDWTGDVDLLSELTPNLLAALEWIDRYGDLDGDGLVEYTQNSQLGVRNQGWKDSSDSLMEELSPAPLPAALVEVQGYCYHAKAGLARIFRRLNRPVESARLEAEAQAIMRKFNELFWMPEHNYFCQALDRDKRQVTSITSNPGHGLWSTVIDRGRAAHVVKRLMAPDMFSGWGIRTLSTEEMTYNPMSYHNGSVWPHDNSIVAWGMRRYGYRDESELVARSVVEAGMRFRDDRVPELFCGFARDRRFNSGPGEYLVSCSPQAWGAGSVFHFLQVLAGVQPDTFARRIRIDPLDTPLFCRLRVEGMRVADGTLDFTIDSRHGKPRVTVDRKPRGMTLELPA